MVEENNEEKQGEEQANATSNNSEGDKSERFELVDRANEAAERLERANKRKEELLEKEEKLVATRMLGGKSEAGQQEEKEPEKTPQEFANDYLNGKISENILRPSK